MTVENVTFTRNGHGWPDPAYLPDAWDYGGLVIGSFLPSDKETIEDAASIVIRESHFEGNVPYALAHGAFATVQATNNWWGDPAGPSHRPLADVSASTPGGPEVVFGPVVTAPWKTQP